MQKKTINFLSKLDGVQEKVDLVGFHGNTIIHNPKKKISIQLGNPKVLAEKIKIPVVANFRNRDIENFGEGAPLVPIFHKSIFSKKRQKYLNCKYWWNIKLHILIWKNKIPSFRHRSRKHTN